MYKNKSYRRVLALLIAALMCLTMLPTAAFAAEGTLENEASDITPPPRR